MSISKEAFIDKYLKAIDSNTAAIFAGAGLSRDAGYIDWKGLLKNIAEELHLDIEKEAHDLTGLAQYYINTKGNKGHLNEIIMDEFSKKATKTKNHEILSKLPITTYWTTNYDKLIEKSLEEAGKIVDIKTTHQQLTVSVADKDVIVYKMHGDVSDIGKIVLTRDDYERYPNTHAKFREILEGDLLSKTFLFVGFSFADPNINYILTRIRLVLGENTRPHYYLVKKVQRYEFDTEEEFIYAEVKQNLHIKDLSRFSIHAVFVDSYEEITEILDCLYQRHKRKTIFISGSAETYEPFSEDTAKYFLHNLSKGLVENDFKLVSGFGLGVGSYVINGVADYCFNNKSTKFQDHLTILPFPQDSSGGIDLKTIWNQNRLEMISESGIALFLFGNKKNPLNSNEIIDATGLIDEFKIAESQGLILLPIQNTGHMSKILTETNDITSQFNTEITQKYKSLIETEWDYTNKDSIKLLINQIISIINLISKAENGE